MTSTMKQSKAGYLLAVLFWILVWQTAVIYVNRSLLLPIPSPLEVVRAGIRLLQNGVLLPAVCSSLLRITAGFITAFILAAACALFSAKNLFFRTLTAPLLSLIRAIPVASFTILIFLWISRERIPTAISFVTVFPIIWANVETGALSQDKSLTEMAQVFGMEKKRILREITLPALKPFLSAAAAGGMGFAWKSGVAAEIICRTDQSLGNLLWAGKSSICYDEVFAVTLVIVLLSALLQKAASSLMKGGRDHA